MNTPHERLTRTTFSLPLREVHALVGGAVNARPLLFLHCFPDHPPTDDIRWKETSCLYLRLEGTRKSCPVRAHSASSGFHQYFWILSGDEQQLSGGPGRAAGSIFPTHDACGPDAKIRSKHRLAHVELVANGRNVFWLKLGLGGNVKSPQCNFLSPGESVGKPLGGGNQGGAAELHLIERGENFGFGPQLS